jgi:integrase
MPMKTIQDWLGHSDIGTTANIYSHIDSESKKASAIAIGTALG